MICPFCKKENATISLVSPVAINGVRPLSFYRCFECEKTWDKEFDLLEILSELEHEQWRVWTEGKWRELRNIKRDLDEAMDVNLAIR